MVEGGGSQLGGLLDQFASGGGGAPGGPAPSPGAVEDRCGRRCGRRIRQGLPNIRPGVAVAACGQAGQGEGVAVGPPLRYGPPVRV